jgi:acylphosphatase
MPDAVRLHATVSGFVQGVNFRYYTLGQAQNLGVRGYVRNCEDGTVEVVAEGERSVVDRLLAWLHAGPPSAYVEKVDYAWEDAQGEFRQFEVRF